MKDNIIYLRCYDWNFTSVDKMIFYSASSNSMLENFDRKYRLQLWL